MEKVNFTSEQVEPILQKFWNLSLNEKVTEFFSINGKVLLVTVRAGEQYILKVSIRSDSEYTFYFKKLN